MAVKIVIFFCVIAFLVQLGHTTYTGKLGAPFFPCPKCGYNDLSEPLAYEAPGYGCDTCTLSYNCDNFAPGLNYDGLGTGYNCDSFATGFNYNDFNPGFKCDTSASGSNCNGFSSVLKCDTFSPIPAKSVCTGVVSSGRTLSCASNFPTTTIGITVLCDYIYDGILTAEGNLPLFGTVKVKGILPTSGASTISHGCGDRCTVVME